MHLVCVRSDCRTPSTSTRSPASRMRLRVSRSVRLYESPTKSIRYSVAEKLKREGRNEIFEQETMEELEDEEGNVYNRKTYEDLKKQGLI